MTHNPQLDDRLSFRTACKGDVTDLCELYHQSMPEVTTSPESMEKMITASQNNPDNRTIVGIMDGKVVATFQLILYDNPVRAPKRKAVIDSVVVNETARNQGIGTAMMDWAVAFLRDEGCSHIGVASRYSRKVAHHVYQKLDFEQFGYYFLFRA